MPNCGQNIVHMVQGGNSLHFWYDAQSRPAIVDFNGTKYAYILNLQGDVVGLKNSAGTEVVRYTYDAWGKILATTGTLAATLGYLNPFRYRGYVYDEETGLYYVSSRYYDPEACRFINADDTDVLAVEQVSLLQYNLFVYCLNNPVNRTDDSGYLSIPNWLKVTIGVAAIAVGVINSGPHNIWHWQRNVWNPRANAITGGAKHWTLFGRRF